MGLQVGLHILAEMCGCPPDLIATKKVVRERLLRATSAAGLKVVGDIHHQFNPHGVTSLVVLRESHISLHTWPEYGYAAVDIFTCGSYEKAHLFIAHLASELRPKTVRKVIVKRGARDEEGESTDSPRVEGEAEVFLEPL